MASRRRKTFEKSINLALQGGGAHGAFTWGVLDRLLEDGRIYIEAISGTSAGAMNAVIVADGLMRAGEDGARESLARFWKGVSDAARLSPIQRGPIDVFMGNWSLDNSPSFILSDLLNRITSPYDVNPFNLNPLKDLLEREVDFDLVRSCDKIKIFVSATNVETGRVKGLCNQCRDRPCQGVQPSRVDLRDGHGLGLPPVHVSGGRNRRRALLGRWLHGKSSALSIL
jgi:NTE family protein